MPAMIRLITACLLALSVFVGACDLPQNKDKTAGGDATVTTDGGPWKLLRIHDLGGTEAVSLPGADIDAIVVFDADGVFISAGCTEATLFGEDELLHADNPHLDPAKGTLSFREGSEASGFVSLGAGTLVCELPIAVVTGDVIHLFEITADKTDSYEVSLAEDAADGETVSLGAFSGSVEIIVP